MLDYGFRFLPQVEVTDGSTSPVPAQAGTWAWSLQQDCPAFWDGTVWTLYKSLRALSDCASLDSDIVTNGSFSGSASGWTLGSGWAYGTNNVVCTLGGSAEGTLEQTLVFTGGYYLVEWTQTNSVAGNALVRPVLDGTNGTYVCPADTSATVFQQVIQAGLGPSHTITFEVSDQTSTGTITIDSVSVKYLTESPPTRSLMNTSGTVVVEERIASTPTGLNTVLGSWSGRWMVTAYGGTFVGNKSGSRCVSGYQNSAFGHNTLSELVNGFGNTAIGQASQKQVLNGSRNSALGAGSLRDIVAGYDLVGIGYDAGRYINSGALNTRSIKSVYLGADARPSLDGNTNEIVIGYGARGNGSNTATLGDSNTTVYGAKHNTNQVDLVSGSTPNAPSTDLARLWSMEFAGRIVPATRGPRGLPFIMQRMIGRGQVCWAQSQGPGTAALNSVGITLTVTGSWSNLTVDGSNRAKWVRRIQAVAGPTTNAVAGWREVYTAYCRGNTPGVGGFFKVLRFGPGSGGTNSTKRLFAGFRKSTAAPTDIDPATQTDCFGVGYAQGTDSNVQFMHNDSADTCTKVDLGANFPIATSDHGKWYELSIYAEPNGSAIYYRFEDLDSGAVATGSVSSDIPSNTTFLTPCAWASVGGTNAMAGIALGFLGIETEY